MSSEITATRRILPERRHTETHTITFRIPSSGASRDYAISIGYFETHAPFLTPAEVFVSGTKVGSEVEAVARDAAVLLSIALQCGVPLEAIKHSITREQDGKPSSIMGAIVDHLADNRPHQLVNHIISRLERIKTEISTAVHEAIEGKQA